MIKIENIEVYGWGTAIRGARNPMNSWDKIDTVIGTYWGEIDGHECYDNDGFTIGKNDYKLLKNLCIAGTDHRKWMRMVNVTMDITGPLYWWKEFDTYKVGTVANSCSTMHKIHEKEFTLEDFSHEHLFETSRVILLKTINQLNSYRDLFINHEDNTAYDKKSCWWQLIQLLPSSYNQKRTVQLNYEVLNNIYHARKNHKLDEWHTLCEEIEKLPYSEFITMNFKGE